MWVRAEVRWGAVRVRFRVRVEEVKRMGWMREVGVVREVVR